MFGINNNTEISKNVDNAINGIVINPNSIIHVPVQLTSVEQEGEPTIFKRLTYKDNEILESLSLDKIYDHIRMVDDDDYKHAYINFGDYRIEFSNADFKNNEILAKVRFIKKKL